MANNYEGVDHFTMQSPIHLAYLTVNEILLK